MEKQIGREFCKPGIQHVVQDKDLSFHSEGSVPETINPIHDIELTKLRDPSPASTSTSFIQELIDAFEPSRKLSKAAESGCLELSADAFHVQRSNAHFSTISSHMKDSQEDSNCSSDEINISALTTTESDDEAFTLDSFVRQANDSFLGCHFPSASELHVFDSVASSPKSSENLSSDRQSMGDISFQDDSFKKVSSLPFCSEKCGDSIAETEIFCNENPCLVRDSTEDSSSLGYQKPEERGRRESGDMMTTLCERKSQEPSTVIHAREENQKKYSTRRKRRNGSERSGSKDRQRIQMSLQQLRAIIPNAGKCSIDALLEQTVQYMMLLRNLEQQQQKQQQQQQSPPHKRLKVTNNNCKALLEEEQTQGTSWLMDTEMPEGERSFPAVVQDLRTQGRMLVKILCEGDDVCLNLSAKLKRLGLKILSSMLEHRDGYIWAEFMVQAPDNINRVDVLSFLANFLGSSSNVSYQAS